MRNAGPFVADRIIALDCRAVVLIIESLILITHPVSRKDLTCFDRLVSDILELGKHGLSEQSSTELLKIHVQQVLSHARISLFAEEIVHQEGLVDC